MNEHIGSDIEVIEDIIHVKGTESLLTILKKTVDSMRILDGKYDYILRTNISTIVDVFKLFNFLKTVPITNYYGSSHIQNLQWTHPPSGVYDTSLFGTIYAQGTCIILSSDLVHSLCSSDNVRHDIVDDVSIGIYINTYHADAMQNLFKYQPTMHHNLNSPNIPDVIFFRNRYNANRDIDISTMKYICANI